MSDDDAPARRIRPPSAPAPISPLRPSGSYREPDRLPDWGMWWQRWYVTPVEFAALLVRLDPKKVRPDDECYTKVVDILRRHFYGNDQLPLPEFVAKALAIDLDVPDELRAPPPKIHQPEGAAHAVTAPQITSSNDPPRSGIRFDKAAAAGPADWVGDIAATDHAPAATEIVTQLSELIFDQHPRDGGDPITRVQLMEAAQKAGLRFAVREFNDAYGTVYKSKANRPPKGGWPLKELYRIRLAAE
jgi:hypothetical protein